MLNDNTYSVLVVSSGDKFNTALISLLTSDKYSPVVLESTAGGARRRLIEKDYDIVVINAPLPDEFGASLALDVATEYGSGVMLCLKAEHYDEFEAKTESYGILTISKPTSKQILKQSLQLLCATRNRIMKFKRKTASFEEKIKDIQITNRAKLLLIENLKMSEEEAHKYIEKLAMNSRRTKREIADNIINEYTKP